MSEEKVFKYNIEQFEILKRCSKNKDITEWNEYRKNNRNTMGKDIEEIILRNTLLHAAHLKGADLRDANFEGAYLGGTNFEGAYLGSANLKGADLRRAHLKGVNLYKAILIDTDLEYANLEGANLSNVNLKGANLSNAHLEGAFLSGVHLERAVLISAHLKGVNLCDANLVGADLRGANLEGANLTMAHLEDTDLYKANLVGADLMFANLVGASLIGAHLENSDIRNIYIGEYEYEESKTRLTNFEGALFGDSVLSFNKDCETPENKIIESLSKAEVNNVRFIDPVFGRKVRDEAWLYHFKKGPEKNKYSLKYRLIRVKIIKKIESNMLNQKNSIFSSITLKWLNWRSDVNKRKMEAPLKKRILLWLWKISSNYGRNIGLWAFWSIMIATYFGLNFWLIETGIPKSFEISNKVDLANTWHSIQNFLYYSVVTFTTLGFGDITPTTLLAQRWVMAEVILGYIMLGGLISIFANKLARRND